MKITAIIERGTDGYYSVRSEEKVGRFYFGGFGDTVKAAKADFQSSIKESMADAKEEGATIQESLNIVFRYDIPSFFNYFDYLNVSKFAEFAGINESKMRAYKCGVAYPGEKTTRKIMQAIERIGQDLSATIL